MPSLAPTRPIWIATEPGQLRYRQDFADWVARAARHLAIDVARVQAVVDDPQQDQALFDKLVDYGLRKERPPFRPGSMAPEMERLSGNDVPDCTECGQRHPEGERLVSPLPRLAGSPYLIDPTAAVHYVITQTGCHHPSRSPYGSDGIRRKTILTKRFRSVKYRWVLGVAWLPSRVCSRPLVCSRLLVQKRLMYLTTIAVPGETNEVDEVRTRRKYYQSHFYVQTTCRDPFLGRHEVGHASSGDYESISYWRSPSPSSSLQARTPRSCSIPHPLDTSSKSSGSSRNRLYMPGLNGLQDEISDLKKDLKTARDGIQAAEEKQRSVDKLLEDERSAKKAAEVAHAAQVKQIEDERDSARVSFRQLDEKQRQWQDSLQMVRDGVISVDEWKAKVDELEHFEPTNDDRITSLEQEKTLLETALDLANENKTELHKALESVNTKLSAATDRVTALEAAETSAVVELNAALEAAKKKVDHAVNRAKEAKEAKEAAIKALKAASKTKLHMKDQNMEALKKRITTLKDRVARLEKERMQDLENSQIKVVSLQNELAKTQIDLQTANTRIQDANTRIQDDAIEVERIRVERNAAQTELQAVKRSMDEMGRALLSTEQGNAASAPGGTASGSGRTTGPKEQLDVFATKLAPTDLVGQFCTAYRAYKNSSGNNLEIKIKVLQATGLALRGEKEGNFVPSHRPGQEPTRGAEVRRRLVLAAQSRCRGSKTFEILPTRRNWLKVGCAHHDRSRRRWSGRSARAR
jgi:predicted  nucleic acid-binding Zn-ribbon protein